MIIQLSEMAQYKDDIVNVRLLRVIEEQGLIVPILVNEKNEVHEADYDRFIAFRYAAEELKAKGNDEILVCYWSGLDKEEKVEFKDRFVRL